MYNLYSRGPLTHTTYRRFLKKPVLVYCTAFGT